MTINDTNISGEKSSIESTGERNRGFGLTLIILAIIVLSTLVPINDFYEGFYVNHQINSLVLGLITLTNIVFGVALWKWMKWGLYGIIAVLLVNGGFFLAFSDFGRAFITIALFPGLLIIFTRDAWKKDERLLDKTESERIRGWFLSLVILFILFGSVYSGISNIYQGYFYGDFALILLGFLNITGAIFAYAIWKWKKWGVYGTVAVVLIFAGVLLAAERYIDIILDAIVLPGILIFAIRNKWNQFD